MSNRLLVIDTETGGFDPLMWSILSIGAVVWEDGNLLGEAEVLVAEQPVEVEAGAMKVNRIDLKEHVAIGLAPKRAVATFENFILEYFPQGKVPLAGHNVGFDIGFLQRLYRLAGVDFETRFSHRSIDTSSIMNFLRLAGKLPIPNSSLDSGLRYFRIEVKGHERHSALADARATAKVLTALIELVRGPANVSPMLVPSGTTVG